MSRNQADYSEPAPQRSSFSRHQAHRLAATISFDRPSWARKPGCKTCRRLRRNRLKRYLAGKKPSRGRVGSCAECKPWPSAVALKAALHSMITFANAETGEVWISAKTLGASSGLKERAAKLCRSSLVQLGMIELAHPAGHEGRRTPTFRVMLGYLRGIVSAKDPQRKGRKDPRHDVLLDAYGAELRRRFGVKTFIPAPAATMDKYAILVEGVADDCEVDFVTAAQAVMRSYFEQPGHDEKLRARMFPLAWMTWHAGPVEAAARRKLAAQLELPDAPSSDVAQRADLVGLAGADSLVAALGG